MEVAALKHRSALRGPTPFLRLQSDERLVTLTRRGNQSAYEVLVSRYQARLLAFCRHMLSSKEDAEDVLQEVFAAAFSAMMADERTINVRPWLYRIARNRSLNHLRKQTAIGVDSMDVHLADHGTSTADRVHKREEFRQLVGDVQELPETQRTALLLREIDALSYEQIAQAMETTVPAIKSLLVRARVSLAEAAEARALSCEEVRAELGEVAEGLKGKTPPVRRHIRGCDRCKGFEKSLQQTNRALAAMFPVGPLLLLKKFLLTQGAGSAAGAASAASGSAAAGAGAGMGGAGALTAGLSAVATKTAAVMAGAAIVTAGAVEVDHSRHVTGVRAKPVAHAAAPAAATPAAAAAPRVVATTPQPVRSSNAKAHSPAVVGAVAAAKAAAHAKAVARHKLAAAEQQVTGAATGATGSSSATGPTAVKPVVTATVKPRPVETGSDATSLNADGTAPAVILPPVPAAQPAAGTTTAEPQPAADPQPAPEPQAQPAPTSDPQPADTSTQAAPAPPQPASTQPASTQPTSPPPSSPDPQPTPAAPTQPAPSSPPPAGTTTPQPSPPTAVTAVAKPAG